MSRWNLKQLRDDVANLYGREQLERLKPSLESVVQRQRYARHHFLESERRIKEVMADPVRAEKHPLELWDDEEVNQAHDDARAEIVACVQSMHAVADILAHVVYFALAMDGSSGTALKERDISVKRVPKQLPAGAIKEMLDELKGHTDFVYLEALVNHCKHRSLIPIPYHYDLSGALCPKQGFWFADFTYDRTFYIAREAEAFLKDEYKRQSRLVIDIGNALNAEVRRRLAAGKKTGAAL
jgi:hypothetical protein